MLPTGILAVLKVDLGLQSEWGLAESVPNYCPKALMR